MKLPISQAPRDGRPIIISGPDLEPVQASWFHGHPMWEAKGWRTVTGKLLPANGSDLEWECLPKTIKEATQ